MIEPCVFSFYNIVLGVSNPGGTIFSCGGASSPSVVLISSGALKLSSQDLILSSAGNGDDPQGYYSEEYPAAYDNVLSVSAIGCSGSWGGWATYHESVDLAAPGENILSAVIGEGYDSWDGSSMASPIAA